MNAPVEKTVKWVDLSAYGDGAVIKVLPDAPGQQGMLVLLGIDPESAEGRAVATGLGFRAVKGRPAMLRMGSTLPSAILKLLPKARVRDMRVSEIVYSSRVANESNTKDLDVLLRTATFLGLNHVGHEVYAGANGRFMRMEGGVHDERQGGAGSLYLRAGNNEELALCADGFVEQMMRGKVMRSDDLRTFAATVHSLATRQMDVEDLRLRQTQEAIEAAIGRRQAREFPVVTEDGFRLAVKLLEHQPPFAFRTSESVMLQQYSTPVPMSLAAQRILGDTSGKRGLEPTIGNASLVMALPVGTQIDGIEIDPKRVERASRMREGLTVREGDFLSQTLAADYDFVISNPPFGGLSRSVEWQGLRVTRVDQLVALKALAARKENGRGVFLLAADRQNIFDKNAGEISGGSKNFFNWLADHYEIEDCVEIDGGLYAKQGAGFPVRMVTVGRRRSEDEARKARETKEFRLPERIPVMRSWDELWERADKLALSLGETMAEEIEARARIENDFQAPYIAASEIGEPTAMVPRNLVGPIAQAFARLEAEYGMTVDELVSNRLRLDRDALAAVASPEQIDGVALGIRAIEQNAGLILGDQTGQGKGRQLALMALYARRRGMPVVFLTEKANLFSDFYRDLKDSDVLKRFETPLVLNGNNTQVRDMDTNKTVWKSYPRNELDGLMQADMSLKDGGIDLMFATYSQFNRDTSKSKKSDWIAKAVEGALVILDESHVAAGDGNIASNIAQAVANAGACLYSSATYAKGAKNMACYAKAFPASVSVGDLTETLIAGGEPLQEVLSSMLAADGRFIRREHDLSRLTFRVHVDEANRKRNEEASDQLAEILSAMSALSGDVEVTVARLQKQIREYLKNLSEEQRKGNRMGVSYTNFGSRLYNVMRQYMLAIKAESVADLMIEAYRNGEKPVAATEQTFETLLKEHLALSDDENPEDLVDLSRFGEPEERERKQEARDHERLVQKLDGNRKLELQAQHQKTAEQVSAKTALTQGSAVIDSLSFRDVLYRMLDKIVVINERSDYGTVSKTDVFQKAESKDEAEGVMLAVAHIRKLIDAFPDLPAMPIDVLRNKLEAAGISIDEISGRAYTVQFMPDGRYAVSPRPDDRVSVNYKFNNGDIDAAVITRAGSTGLSLHASERFADQRQRHLFELQIANNVSERMQFWGRVDRRGQVCSPIITTPVTTLPAEVRVLAMQNAKLRKLSANVSSNRNNAAEMDVPDMLNPIGDVVAKSFLLENPRLALKIGFTVEELEDPDGSGSTAENPYINRLMGRLCLIPVAEQKRVIDDLTQQFNGVLLELEQQGRNPLRAYEQDWRARTVKEVVVQGMVQDYYHSEFDRPVIARTIEWEEDRQPMRSSEALEAITVGKRQLLQVDGIIEIRAVHAWDKDGLGFSRYAARVGDLCLDLAELAKPKRFETVAEALADVNANACKEIVERGKWISNHLHLLAPGALIQVNDPQSIAGVTRNVIVLELGIPPGEFAHRPGEYTVKILAPGASRPEVMTFAQLMRDESFRALGPRDRFSLEFPTWQEALDGAPAGKLRRERTVLVGNVFAASEIAAKTGMGISGVYTDEQGLRHRGIILFQGVSMKAVQDMPLSISNAVFAQELAREAVLSDEGSITMASSPKIQTAGLSSSGLRLRVDARGIKLTTIGTKQEGGRWFANSKLLEVTGDWAGSRQNMSVEVPLTKLETLMNALYTDCETTFYVGSEHKEALQVMVTTYQEEIRAKQERERDRIACEVEELNREERYDTQRMVA